MSTEQNKALVRRFYDEIVNQRKVHLVEEFIAPGWVKYWLNDSVPPDGFNRSNFPIFYSFPDLQTTLENVFAEGDKVATRGYHTGTHKGDFMGLAPSGKHVKFGHVSIWRVEHDKLAEFWPQDDVSGLMEQLGFVPQPAQGG